MTSKRLTGKSWKFCTGSATARLLSEPDPFILIKHICKELYATKKMRYILQKIIIFYQIVLSPLFPGVCRFYPSCSDYSREAIRTHGSVKGLLLTFLRLARCNPVFRSGVDPVPQSFTLRNFIDKISGPDPVPAIRSEKSRIRSQNT